jgi:hypothetical protein
MSKMNYTAVLLIALLLATTLTGLFPSAWGANGGEALFEELKPMVEVYNQNVEKIPMLQTFIGAERIRAEIALNGGSALIIGITTDNDAKVTDLVLGEVTNPTIKAYTDENTVRSILASSDPVTAFENALETGAIRFEGVGFENKLRIGIMKLGLKILGFFT